MSDFITDFPALLKYWNFDSNIKLEIEKLAITSKKHVSWKCPNCSYEWKASVAKSYKQVLNHTKICPVCDLGEVLVKGENAISDRFPNFLEYINFHYENIESIQNEIENLTFTSKRLFHFKCPTCHVGWKDVANTSRLLTTKLNKKEVVYSVSEVNVPKGYTVENSGLKDGKIVLTNKHNPVEKEVSVEKKWNDENNNDGIQPTEVTVQLFAGDKAVGAPVKLNKENNWKHVFSNLKAKAEGKDIEYTVKEVDVPEGYTVTVEGKNNIVITNTHVPALTELSVIKLWEDENNKDSSRPASITVQLFANDKPQGDVVVLNEENSWKHTFANLKAKVNGEVVNYEVREINVPSGYTVTTTVGENGEVVLTNTHKPILPPPPVVEIPPKPWTPTPPPAPQLPPKKVEVKPKQLAKTGVENDMSAMLVSTILLGAAAVLRRKKTN